MTPKLLFSPFADVEGGKMGKGQKNEWIDFFPCRMVKTDVPSDIESIYSNSKVRSEYSFKIFETTKKLPRKTSGQEEETNLRGHFLSSVSCGPHFCDHY